jgi:serine/threonine protein kinase
MSLTVGQSIGGHYKIRQFVGSGGFGETYEAEDSQALGKSCIIKRLIVKSQSAELFEKSKMLFEREALTLMKLSTFAPKNQIPRFFAFFDENHEFYLVQELINGHPLIDEIHRRSLDESQVIHVLESVLNILSFVHNQGVIHRDIKPENLVRRISDNEIVLIDFGSVKDVATQLVIPANGIANANPTLIYTPGYAPVEQRQGSPRFNSDIYALGITAIQCLTGLDPENIKKSSFSLKEILCDRYRVTEKMYSIINKMIDDDWNIRYQSVEDVLWDLHRINVSPLQLSTSNAPISFAVKGKSANPKQKLSKPLVTMLLSSIAILTIFLASFLRLENHVIQGENNPTKSNNIVKPIKFEMSRPEVDK